MRLIGLVLLVILWSCTGGEELSDSSASQTDLGLTEDMISDGFEVTDFDLLSEPDDAEFELDTGLDLVEIWTPDQWNPCPGEAQCQCDTDEDCNYGICLWQCDAYRCTLACTEDCPMGWSCRQVPWYLPDPVYICAPDCMDLCKPCIDNKDCIVGDCLPHGPAGSFCSGPGYTCDNNEDCPDGYSCQETTDVSGDTDTHCVLTEGECTCNQGFIDEAASTTCYVENEFGACTGERYCAEAGLTPCDAPTPVAEVCDGQDNDCDGEIDEDTGGNGCFITNAYGSCPGTEICVEGTLNCDGEPAKPGTVIPDANAKTSVIQDLLHYTGGKIRILYLEDEGQPPLVKFWAVPHHPGSHHDYRPCVDLVGLDFVGNGIRHHEDRAPEEILVGLLSLAWDLKAGGALHQGCLDVSSRLVEFAVRSPIGRLLAFGAIVLDAGLPFRLRRCFGVVVRKPVL